MGVRVHERRESEGRLIIKRIEASASPEREQTSTWCHVAITRKHPYANGEKRTNEGSNKEPAQL